MDDATCKFTSDPQLLFQHPYPATKIMFMPDREGAQPDLLATTGAVLTSGTVWREPQMCHVIAAMQHPSAAYSTQKEARLTLVARVPRFVNMHRGFPPYLAAEGEWNASHQVAKQCVLSCFCCVPFPYCHLLMTGAANMQPEYNGH